MMNFVFENVADLNVFKNDDFSMWMAITNNIGNFLGRNTLFKSSDTRFRFSNFAARFFEIHPRTAVAHSWVNCPAHFVIATRVAHHPNEWAGHPYSDDISLFNILNDNYVRALRNGNAIFLIDQSHEGYQTPWMWEFFHAECERLQINPGAIVYVTGNQNAVDDYAMWRRVNNIQHSPIKVIPAVIFDKFIIDRAVVDLNYNSNFDEILSHKQSSYDEIKLFDCLNHNLYRKHRTETYLSLVKANLDSKGYITMPQIPYELEPDRDHTLLYSLMPRLPLTLDPKFVEEGLVYNRILKNLYKNTWVSVVTEASYYNTENTLFISEKLFKPVTCLHPFIVVGSKGTLQKFKQLGYKTFHPYIDESYDMCDDVERFEKITDALHKLDQIQDKVGWYRSIQPILEHNKAVLEKSRHELTDPFQEFIDYYNTYFNL